MKLNLINLGAGLLAPLMLFWDVEKMVVEMMGLLIFLGVALLLFVRYQGDKAREDVDSEELKVSIESLQKEMDKVSTEAIERMGSQVNRFERLMKEAKTGGEDLSHRIKEIRALEDRLRKEMAESRALSEELKIERERTKDLRDELQRQATLTSRIVNSNISAETSIINITSRNAINAYENASVSPEIVDGDIVGEDSENTNNFAALLTESIEREEERERQNFEPVKEVYEPSEEVRAMLENEEIKTEESKEIGEFEEIEAIEETEEIEETKEIGESREKIKSENSSEVAKRLLKSGIGIDEVMRQTGMGRGAVELLAQMIGTR